MEKELSKVKRFMMDFYKVALLMGLTGYVLYLLDPANAAIFQAMLIAIFLAGGTHLTRRIVFSRIDLQSIALTAVQEKNLPAALVFIGFMAFIISVMHLSMTVFK